MNFRLRGRGVASLQRTPAKQKACTDVLAKHQALAALPGLKLAMKQEIERLRSLAHLIPERGHLNGKVISKADQCGIPKELVEPALRRHADAFPQVIALVEHTPVVGVGLESAIEGSQGASFVAADVEVGNAEVSPCGCAAPTTASRPLPRRQSPPLGGGSCREYFPADRRAHPITRVQRGHLLEEAATPPACLESSSPAAHSERRSESLPWLGDPSRSQLNTEPGG